MQLSEQLLHTTIRIEASLPSGECSVGTGFFFKFCDDGKTFVPAVVTNKHVVKGGYEYRVIFSRADENGNLLNINERLTMRGSDSDWISHPDENVDLCVLPIGPALNGFIQAGKHLLTIPLSLELLPTKTLIKDMGCMEEVTMIGYPNGIWDEANNLPIVRRGITATPYRYDYRGEKEFLVDMACYPGSSGSPVFLYNEGTYLENGAVVVGSRLYLLGILRAVPIRNVLGDITVSTITHVNVQDMLNLGIIIKSERLKDFDPILRERLSVPE